MDELVEGLRKNKQNSPFDFLDLRAMSSIIETN